MVYLKLDDAFFYRVFDDEPSSVDGFELTQTVRAIDRLHLRRGVPPPSPHAPQKRFNTIS